MMKAGCVTYIFILLITIWVITYIILTAGIEL